MKQIILRPIMVPFSLFTFCPHCRRQFSEGTTVIAVANLEQLIGLVPDGRVRCCSKSLMVPKLFHGLDEPRLYLDHFQKVIESGTMKPISDKSLDLFLGIMGMSPEQIYAMVLKRLEEN